MSRTGWATAAVATMGWLATVRHLQQRTEELHERTEELQEARRDPVTGLWTRGGWHQHAHGVVANADTALLLDLDEFKAINDTFGHQTGDLVLEAVAKRLAANLDEHAVVGRFGGDELVAVASMASPSQLEFDVLLEALTQPVPVSESRELPVGVSVGAVHLRDLPTQPPHLNEALAAADQALYTAKRLRTGWELYSPALHPSRPAQTLCHRPVRRVRHHGALGVS